MPASSLAGVFEEFTLHDPGTEPTTDEFGNPIPGTPEVTIIASLKVSNSQALAERFGADSVTVMFEGSAADPAIIPSNVQVGREFDMTFRGRAGKARLEQVMPRKLVTVDDALGQKIVVSFR